MRRPGGGSWLARRERGTIVGAAPCRWEDRPLRFASLDSLRGIAAIAVVLYHLRQCFAATGARVPHWLNDSPLRLLFCGHGAVLVFFALSGFVLFRAFDKADEFRFAPYAIRRFMRIYPPFALAILGSAALCLFAEPRPIPILRDEFGQTLDWSGLPTLESIGRHLALMDGSRAQSLDPPMWSLVHELRISLIFPCIAWCVLRNWSATVVGAFSVSFACTAIVQSHPLDWPYQPLVTLEYLFLFAGGAALSRNAAHVQNFLRRTPGLIRIGLWLAALVAITFPAKTLLGNLTPFAAILLVALCFADPLAQRILAIPIATWLGRISYSLYLVHMPILFTLLHVCWGRLPVLVLLLAVLSSSLAAAELMCRCIERPSIALGRRLSAPRRAQLGARVTTQQP